VKAEYDYWVGSCDICGTKYVYRYKKWSDVGQTIYGSCNCLGHRRTQGMVPRGAVVIWQEESCG